MQENQRKTFIFLHILSVFVYFLSHLTLPFHTPEVRSLHKTERVNAYILLMTQGLTNIRKEPRGPACTSTADAIP